LQFAITYKYCDFQKKEIPWKFGDFGAFHFTKILCMSGNGILFFFLFLESRSDKNLAPPKKKKSHKMQLKPMLLHSKQFLSTRSDLSCLQLYNTVVIRSLISSNLWFSWSGISFSQGNIYIYIYILTLIICSSLKSTLVSIYVFSNLW